MARTSLYPPSVDPGFPRLAPTPSGWSRTTFGAVVEPIERPVTLSPSTTYQLVTAKRSRGGIVSRGALLGREILTKTQFEIKTGDFVISRRQIIHGACGVVPPALDGAIVSNEYSALRTRPGLLMNFLAHYSHTPYFQRTCFHSSHGVDVEKMIFKIDEWLAREVDLPPVAEQRKIAAILSSVDDAIEATQAVIDQLQVVKKAMMAELLTRGLPGRHTRFKQTEIGEVPEEWSVVTLGSLTADSAFGPRFPATKYSDSGQWGTLRTTDITDDWEIDYRTIPKAELDEAQFRPHALQHGDLLVTRSGTCGVVCVFAKQPIDIVPGAFLIRFRLHPTNVPEFVRLAMMTPQTRMRVQALAAGGVQKNLSGSNLAQLLLPQPPLSEQREIVSACEVLERRLRGERAYVEHLRNVKSALLSVLLTGEVRVTPDEEPAQ